MNISEEKINGYYIFGLEGRLDANTSGSFEDKLINKIDDGETNILVNFDRLDYISSSGLRVLLVGAKKLKGKKGKISLCGLKKHIKEVFEIAGFMPVFQVFDKCEEVL